MTRTNRVLVTGKLQHTRMQKKRTRNHTGMGIISPLGSSLQHAWTQLLQGVIAIAPLAETRYSALPSRIAAQIPLGSDSKWQLDLDKHIAKSDRRSMSTPIAFALHAAHEALIDAQWQPTTSGDVIGVSVGVGMIDLEEVVRTHEQMSGSGGGLSKVSPYFINRILPNLAAGQIARRFRLAGPNICASTACASGLHAIGDAFRLIARGDADAMLCGATEACISPLAVGGAL